MAFCISLVQGETAGCYVKGRVVREVEMARRWFRSIFVIFFQRCAKMFTEAMRKFTPCFSDVDYFAQCANYAVDDISTDACKSIIDVDRLLRSSDLGGILDKRTIFKVSG